MTALMLSVTTASAAVTELSIEKDLSHNLIEINGKALPNESVGFQVLPEGMTLQDFAQSDSKNDIIAFVYECKVDAKGMFSVKAVINDSGEYNVNVASGDINVAAIPKSVDFYTSDIYAEKIRLVNEAKEESGENGFVNTAKADENIAVLGFNENINNIVPVEDTLKFMYKELGRNSLDADKYMENVYLYRNSYAVIALNRGVLADIDKYVKNIIDGDETLKKYWEQYIVNDNIERVVINKIKNENISDIEELKEKVVEGMILAATKYPNGYMSLKDLYTDYKDEIGLAKITTGKSAYSAVGGNDYDDLPELKEAYEKASKSGGGSGSGGDKVDNGGSFTSVIVVNPTTSATGSQPHPITLKFLDLSSFEWAYPSISTLYDKGIISGVSEDKFAPAREVKREEFVKMVVSAMKLDMSTGSGFKDVDNDAWYAPYVYAAYNNNVINGISKDEFGVLNNITRQDMAVIVYNAIKQKGYEKADYELAFSDKSDIAGYAEEAVEQLVYLGIISGTGENRFAPTEEATRAQAAVIIERALKYLN